MESKDRWTIKYKSGHDKTIINHLFNNIIYRLRICMRAICCIPLDHILPADLKRRQSREVVVRGSKTCTEVSILALKKSNRPKLDKPIIDVMPKEKELPLESSNASEPEPNKWIPKATSSILKTKYNLHMDSGNALPKKNKSMRHTTTVKWYKKSDSSFSKRGYISKFRKKAAKTWKNDITHRKMFRGTKHLINNLFGENFTVFTVQCTADNIKSAGDSKAIHEHYPSFFINDNYLYNDLGVCTL